MHKQSADLHEQSLILPLGHVQETMPSHLLYPVLTLFVELPLGSKLLYQVILESQHGQLCPYVEQSRGRGDAVCSPSIQTVKSVLFYKYARHYFF